MADHVLTLNLTDEMLARLQAAARAAGVTPHDYAVAILERALASAPPGVREDDTRFDATADGVSSDAEQSFELTFRTGWRRPAPGQPTAEEALAEYDRTSVHETFEEWSAAFEADLKAHLDARR